MRCLTLLLFLLTSCSRDDRQVCEAILLPAYFSFTYLDSDGNDPFFGDNPLFEKDSLRTSLISGGQTFHQRADIEKSPILHFIVGIPIGSRELFIQLSPEIVDTITYHAIVNDQLEGCPESQVISIQRNGNDFEKDPQTQIWRIVYP